MHSLTFTRAAAAFSLLVGIALSALPLVGTLGPESALVLALLLSPWAAAIGARASVHARDERVTTATLVSESIGASWALVAIATLVLVCNAVRIKTCEPLRGLAFMALGPWASVSLAAIVGATIGALIPRPRLAVVSAALFPLAAIGTALSDFVRSPGIFAFGHFFGYFPGTLYDRRIDVPDAWLSHRALSATLGFGLWAFLAATRNTKTGRVEPLRAARHPALLVLVLVSAACAFAVALKAHDFGHTTSRAHVEDKLGLTIQGKHCNAVVPRKLPVGEAHRLAEDCDFRITQLEHTLGVREDERITAFFFRSPQEKRALMGALRVYIAKPWRKEVYLQLGEFPHAVLPHELAHIVARHAARGPFGVPGRLFGIIPEPTLVEGMAVALEPVARDELTAHQWARAAHASKVAPPLSSLLGANFFAANAQLAYTLAGSFLGYVLETRGPEVLRKLYGEGNAESALGESFVQAEERWKTWLARVPLPSPAEALAKQRFERPSVFSQVCPHAVERLGSELSAAVSAGDLSRAQAKCREVLAIDPGDTGTRATLASVLALAGLEGLAQDELARLTKPKPAPRPTVARARTALADAAFVRGRYEEAERTYRAMLNEPQSDAELRQIEVRLIALAAGEPARSLLGELLIGRMGQSTEPRAAMHLIHALYPVVSDGLPHYLEARQLSGAGRYDLAYPLLREASTRGLPTRRLEVEALRMRALSAFVVGALDDARASYARLLARPDVSLAEQLEATDFIARVAFRKSGR